MIHTYKRKGIIQAVQYTGTNKEEIIDFSGGDIRYADLRAMLKVNGHAHFLKVNDTWIIKDEDGDIQSASNGAFQQTYEVVV